MKLDNCIAKLYLDDLLMFVYYYFVIVLLYVDYVSFSLDFSRQEYLCVGDQKSGNCSPFGRTFWHCGQLKSQFLFVHVVTQ